MKQEKNFAWMMVIAMACMMMTACSLDSYEPEEPVLIIEPVEEGMLAACGISESGTRSVSDEQLLFTEKDIEWFNATTREIKFRDMDKPPYEMLEPFHEICYPLYLIDTDEVKANIKKNEGQWELFIYYLESKGKLR